MKRIPLILYFISQFLVSTAQDRLTVNRPGIAETPFTVSPGVYQFETGFDFLRTKGLKEHGLDGGVTFLLWPLIQVDFSAGVSWVDRNPNYFVSSGFAFRIQ